MKVYNVYIVENPEDDGYCVSFESLADAQKCYAQAKQGNSFSVEKNF